MHDMPDHKEGVNFVFQCLLNPEFGAIKSLDEIDAEDTASCKVATFMKERHR